MNIIAPLAPTRNRLVGKLATLALLFLGFSATHLFATDGAMIASYTAVWKQCLAEASGISASDLEPLIEVKSTEMRSWNSGKSFRVRYAIKTGWLTCEKEDCFTVWLNGSEDAYRGLPLRRDAWFTLPEIRTVLEKRVFDTSLGKIDPAAKPRYANLDEAKAFVMKKYNISKLDRAEVAYYVPGKVPHEDGAPYLLWKAIIDDRSNKLREGFLNLFTGAEESHENAIRYYSGPPSMPPAAPTDPTPESTGRGIVPGH